MPEPATTTAAAVTTIAAATATIPVLTILGIPLGVPPETLIAGFFGGLVGVILLNTVPPSDSGAWAAICTAAHRMVVTFASSLTAGYVAPMFSGIIAVIPGVSPYGALLGSAFLVGAGAQRVMAKAVEKFAPAPPATAETKAPND